jgi:hypothetical protein
LEYLSWQFWDWAYYFIQTANIAFPGDGTYGWSPIGNAELAFSGNYNGNFHTIKNLKRWVPRLDYLGFFGRIDAGAVISNLGLTNVNFYGTNYVGGLVGYSNNSTVTNCYVTGSVNGDNNYVGGLVGYIYSGTITNAYSTANVNGTNYVGGLLGDVASGTVTNAYSLGTVGGVYKVGGLVGRNSTGTFNNCFWDTQFSGQSSSEGGTGKNRIEMRTQSTFTGWDFTSGTGQWQMSAESRYRRCPGLQGFTYDVPFTTPAVNPLPGIISLYSGGDGTSGSPFQIATRTDLEYLSWQFWDWAYYFVQTANIAFPGDGTYGWSPIGNIELNFSGNYNGNYHTINNLKINEESNRTGLFGLIGSGAVISNIGLTNVDIRCGYTVGGLVAVMRGGTVTNCYVTGYVIGYAWVGGMVGYMYSGTITNAYSEVRTVVWNTSVGEMVGGMVGKMESGTITNAYASGWVGVYTTSGGGGACKCLGEFNKSPGDGFGGLIGKKDAGTVNNCFWDTQSSGQSNSAGGTPKTTFEMRTQSTFTGWNFTPGTGQWQIASGYRCYPCLEGFTYDTQGAVPAVNPVPGLI